MLIKVNDKITLEVPNTASEVNYSVWTKIVHYRFLMSELGHNFPEKLGLAWNFLTTKKDAEAQTQIRNMERMFQEIRIFADHPEYNPCILAVACMVQETVIEEIEELRQDKKIRECLTDKLLIKTAKWLIDNGLTQKEATLSLAFFFKGLNADIERRTPEIVAESKRFQKEYIDHEKIKTTLILERIASMNTKNILTKYNDTLKRQIKILEPAKLILTTEEREKGILSDDVKRDNAFIGNTLGIAKYMNTSLENIESYTVLKYLITVLAIENEVKIQKQQVEKFKN